MAMQGRFERGRKLLLAVHIIATVGVLGADLVLLTLGLASLAGAAPQTIYPAAALVAARLVAPLALVALGSGLVLGLLTRWGLFRYWWVTIKLALTVVLTAVVWLVLAPRLSAAAAAVGGAANAELAAPGPLVIAPAIASSLLIVMVLLAVFKPGWHIRPRAGEQR